MPLRLPSIRLLLLMLLVAAPALCVAQSAADTPDAAPATDTPYTATVPVPDSSAEQRNHGFEVALTKVLARTAGQDLSQAPGYGKALAGASDYVRDYQYQKNPQGDGFTLQVHFDQAAIQSLIRRLHVTPAPSSGAAAGAPAIGGVGTLWVDGVTSATGMAQLLAALRDDMQVVSVRPIQADGNGLLLRVNARVSMQTLTQSLIAGGTLAADPAGHAGADASARWPH